MELRDTTGDKISFVSVGITRVVLLFRKSSDNRFWFILYTKWLLKIQLIFRGHARQRGRGFGALAQTLVRIAIPFIKKHIVPAAKRIGADLFEISAPEIGEVFSGRKNSKPLQKLLKQKTNRKQLGMEKRNPSVEKEEAFL